MKKKLYPDSDLRFFSNPSNLQTARTVQDAARPPDDWAKRYGQAFAALVDANRELLADTQARNRLRSRLLLDATQRFGPGFARSVEAELGRSLGLLAANLLLAQLTGGLR